MQIVLVKLQADKMWRNRQIKTLINRNGRHLNTSDALA